MEPTTDKVDFTEDELAAYARFSSYPFDKDRVFVQGLDGVKKRAEEKWAAEHPDEAASGDDASASRKEFIDMELIGAKIFYFEVAHSTKIDVNRLNSFLTLRSSGLLPAASSATAKPTHVFEAFERYDFSHDPGFEAGINAILERHKEGKDRDDAVEKAKSWYYNRFIQPMDYTEYVTWKTKRDAGEEEGVAAAAADGEAAGETVKTESAETTTSSATAPSATLQSDNVDIAKTAADSSQTEKAAISTEAASADASSAEPRYPASFMELCQMLAEGKPIPGIREIPNKINEGTPSEAKEAPRKKPWEK